MACNITIDFTEAPAVMVQGLEKKVVAQGGTFIGDEGSGSINVPLLGSNVSGTFTIAGQQMHLVITDKPFFVSCNQIQGYLSGNL